MTSEGPGKTETTEIHKQPTHITLRRLQVERDERRKKKKQPSPREQRRHGAAGAHSHNR